MKSARGENEDIKTPEKYEREKVERQGEELPCKTEDDGNERHRPWAVYQPIQ